ncbi:MAG TPA: ABC transporter permease [Trebonia sp.]|jgi:putative ABC transport system permease protein
MSGRGAPPVSAAGARPAGPAYREDDGYPRERRGAGNWLSVVRTASGGMLRHKVQAVVIVAVLFIATASATLGLALLNASSSPFGQAFAAQHGADATVTANPGRASAAKLAATAHLAGVTALAGPFDATSVKLDFQGEPWGQNTLVGRAGPGGPVDDLVLSSGHWADGPGQVVLATNSAPGVDPQGYVGPGGPVIGSTLTASGLPGQPVLTVVGFANSVTGTADGWVTPGELTDLLAPGSQPTAQLLYRFASAGTAAQLRSDMAAVTGALPAGTVEDWGSWLSVQQSEGSNAAIMEPFVLAFALIGLVMAVLIVGNVISGAVIAQYQRIGVLKSLGLTPAQVVAVYLSRIGWPALVGCVFGVAGGYLLAIPVLSDSANAYGVGHQGVPLWALLLAPAGLLVITLLAAFGPALRAGRLSAVEAIAAGRAPGAGRGYAAHRLAARLGLPRPVSLGLAAPFARPARTLVTLAAVAFGATAVIFATGLHSSLDRAQAAQTLAATVPVQVWQNNPGAGPNQVPSTAQLADAAAALKTLPGTAHQNAEYHAPVKVVGLSQDALALAFDGPSDWMGYALISGHWYDGPGQVDVNTTFLTATGLAVGDSATVYTGTVTTRAVPVTVRIAGEIFDPSGEPRVFTGASTLPGAATSQNFDQWNIGLKPGTTAAAYSRAVSRTLGGSSPFMAGPPGGGQFYVIASALIGLLSLMVAIAAGLGVLNTVLMTTRDRVHDLGVFKALGMRPGQVLVMVVCWVVGPALIAGAVAAPAAVLLNTATLRAMAATAHTGVPASFTDVFPDVRLALLSLAALGLAVVGSLLPAAWAARARPATALRAE